ncbi:MAG: histidine kinase [Coriobacteriales bacterium]|jgi:two-component system sensor histidine kinase LytS|nr:histidine kinase [Coriobacteriales bacterium]
MQTRRLSLIEAVLIGVAALLALIAVAVLVTHGHWAIIVICVLGIIAVVLISIRSSIDPDRLRARQSERTLNLAAKTMTFMRQGLNEESAGAVCRLLLPATSANAVAITSTEIILGFAGTGKESHPIGDPIRTKATREALATQKMLVITSPEDINYPPGDTTFKAAIIVPLLLRNGPAGVLKFYYRTAKRIDETEQAMAFGFGSLLAMQLSLADLDEQRDLAAKMELKALQAQINPHFLFNTINTIASLIRTDPAQARILLREFATFYRRTLEGSLDQITIEQERLQTLRYLGFEFARFGRDRILLECDIEKGLEDILVPAFIIQPIVENAVGHGMKDDTPLHIEIMVREIAGEVVITVQDNGIGMTRDVVNHMLDSGGEHMGIALKNVDDRLKGFFGRDAGLSVKSELGAGTTVSLRLGPLDRLKVVTNDKSDNS